MSYYCHYDELMRQFQVLSYDFNAIYWLYDRRDFNIIWNRYYNIFREVIKWSQISCIYLFHLPTSPFPLPKWVPSCICIYIPQGLCLVVNVSTKSYLYLQLIIITLFKVATKQFIYLLNVNVIYLEFHKKLNRKNNRYLH